MTSVITAVKYWWSTVLKAFDWHKLTRAPPVRVYSLSLSMIYLWGGGCREGFVRDGVCLRITNQTLDNNKRQLPGDHLIKILQLAESGRVLAWKYSMWSPLFRSLLSSAINFSTLVDLPSYNKPFSSYFRGCYWFFVTLHLSCREVQHRHGRLWNSGFLLLFVLNIRVIVAEKPYTYVWDRGTSIHYSPPKTELWVCYHVLLEYIKQFAFSRVLKNMH